MRCKKVLSHLNAYADHELSSSLSRGIENHLHSCRMCQIEFDQIQHVEGFLNTLDVPPVPQEFAARVMIEARKAP
ncbi:MAG: zf-HC2 domain-containing protein [Deltaproteobacteria bacterium]|nr:zf-HC2 domain-containing protein [Deltaproteobacteria bacterium]